MKTSYEVRARLFLNQIYPFIKDCVDVGDYCEAVDKFNATFHRAVRIANGLTRVALITSDYVIKIDCGARHNISRFGGCENEYHKYQKIVRDGYGYLFAKISPVMRGDKVVYIMPRIHNVGSEHSNYEDVYYWLNEEENDYVYDICQDLHYNNYGWENGYPVIIDYACG